MDKKEKFIQVSVTALRDPATGKFLPAVPLYVKAEEDASKAEESLIEDIGHLLAMRMKQYMNGLAAAKAVG